MRIRQLTAASVLLTAMVIVSCSRPAYVSEVEQWRADHEAELMTDSGWLTVAGLFWLHGGINTVGKGANFDVSLTDSFKQEKFGEISFHDRKAILTVEPGVEATVDGQPFTTVELRAGENGSKANVVDIGSESFFLIKREDQYGIRLKDKENPPRKSFSGLVWFPVDEKYRVTADFEAFPQPVDIEVPNVLGGNFKLKSRGMLKFELDGRQFTLQPVDEGDKLFIIFRDLTSKSETYGAGRFLFASRAVDGKVILDFNKAENPPCAYTDFATCPLPPKQNQLDIAIPAGEKNFVR